VLAGRMANDPNWNLPEVPSFTLTSPDFSDGDVLPEWARGGDAGGEDRSPALEWSGAPEGTQSFVLTVYDPDAPTGSDCPPVPAPTTRCCPPRRSAVGTSSAPTPSSVPPRPPDTDRTGTSSR